MAWEIQPFEGVGPIRFGMTPSEVEAVIGPPDRRRKGDDGTEYRGDHAPVVNYVDGKVTEIECYYDLEGGVSLDGIDLFERDGIEVMRELEKRSGGALESVGSFYSRTSGFRPAGSTDPAAKTIPSRLLRRGFGRTAWTG
ncbi:hypothetical protein E2F50_20295 [Rhizobium deserti]|uniref:Uncharacterized protein n=1 Tax=Rhizobium deserti TaxID=2547961 RepID=A0A4R5U9I6_9HYPH|nr:hypothetical protein [Rhizobium deserti]TDK31284.1 hypothetical protein E2F50_20295 [Rhizobium deserti]